MLSRGVSFLIAFLMMSAASAKQPPNILFIQTDDQAPWALGLVDQQAKTPHMDALFREGLFLKNTFTVTPVCSPSRASLMTSRYGSELGITDWIHPRKEPEHGLDASWPVWPRLLQKAGYHTGLVGKWHLGLLDQFHPTQFGFDYFMGHRGGGWSPENPKLEKEGRDQKFEGLTTDILADHAIEFLKEHDLEKPFLLCWHTRAPHARWLPVSDDDWAPFDKLDPEIPNPNYPKLDTERVKRVTREYLASVRGVDRNLGRVLASLDQLGLRDNTVVIFTSDHGYNMGHNGIWHKGNGHWILTQPPAATGNIPKGQRPNMYDHSVRVPTAIRWPAQLKPRVVEKTVTNLDWFPTLLSIAGVDVPTTARVRGRTLPLRQWSDGLDDGGWDDDFFAQYSTKHQTRTHMRMVRSEGWKLKRDFLNPERDELYDLVNDPAENTNLIASEQASAVRTSLNAKLLTWMRSINDTAVPKSEVGAKIESIVGTGEQGYSGDGGLASEAKLNQPFGVVIGPDRCLYICDTGNHVIRKVDTSDRITTVVGTGKPGYRGDAGDALQALLNEPYEIRFDAQGNMVFVEMKNHVIRRVDMSTGIISTVAGIGKSGFSGDGGPANKAAMFRPHSIQFGPNGHLYVCDIGNHRLRRIHKDTGIITTISGTGEKKIPRDGQSFAGASLLGPRAIDFDHRGDLWLALREGNAVYQFDMKAGTLHHRAGTGDSGFTGNGGPAKDATLSGPKGVSVGMNGLVYLADTESDSVRAINPKTGVLSLIAGKGEKGDGPDGSPTACLMDRLHGVFAAEDGSVYIGDTNTHRVRVIRP